MNDLGDFDASIVIELIIKTILVSFMKILVCNSYYLLEWKDNENLVNKSVVYICSFLIHGNKLRILRLVKCSFLRSIL